MKTRVAIPRIEEIVSRNLSQWQARQRALGEAGRTLRTVPGPYLAISRQYGTGALELAQELGRILGWRIYDRLLLEELARRAHVPPDVLERIEQGPHHDLHDAILMTLDHHYPGHHLYLRHMASLVADLGLGGRCVLVGRGAHFLLPAAAGVRVRLVAPFESRVDRTARCRGVGAEEAAAWIREADRSQRELIRKLFRRDPDDPAGYDLQINLAHVDLRGARETIVALLRAKLGVEAPGA